MEREYQPKFHKLQPINQLKIFLMSTMYKVHLSTKSGSFNFHSNCSTKELSKGTMNRTIDLQNTRTGYKTINKKFGEKVTSFAVIIWKRKEYKMTVDRPRSEDLASQC